MNRKERRAQAAQGQAQIDPAEAARALDEAARLFRTGRFGEAEQLYRELLRLDPNNAFALSNLGILAQQKGDSATAIKLASRAIAIDGNMPDFHNSAALAYELAGRLDDAIACYRRALSLRPDWPGALSNLGTTLMTLRRFDEAEETCRRAAMLAPDQAQFHNNLGLVLYERGRLDEAIASLERAIALNSAYPEAHNNRGNVLRDQNRLDEALASYERAVALKPDYVYADSNALLVLAYGKIAAPDELVRRSGLWYERHAPKPPPERPTIIGKRDPERRLRIGFVSPDFHMHPIALFMAPLFHAFARPPLSEQIEIFAYADLSAPDAMSARLKRQVAQWRPITGMSDAAVADLVRHDRIDILVDLTGHNSQNRLSLFTFRPAPIQASYLGFPATTGLPCIDYLITDAIAYPDASAEPIVETPVRLDRCMICYQPQDETPPVSPSPNGPIVFGSFNQRSKLSPATIALWSEILHAVPDSRLLMKAGGLGNAAEAERLRHPFAANGIASDRIILRDRTKSFLDHLATYGEIDIALDPLPYNGTTTTVEALWMGVPVLTLAGRTMVERMGTTILTAAGLSEWIAETREEYLAKAVFFAADRTALAARRATQRERISTSPLCDIDGMARVLERAFRTMWRDHLAHEEHQS